MVLKREDVTAKDAALQRWSSTGRWRLLSVPPQPLDVWASALAQLCELWGCFVQQIPWFAGEFPSLVLKAERIGSYFCCAMWHRLHDWTSCTSFGLVGFGGRKIHPRLASQPLQDTSLRAPLPGSQRGFFPASGNSRCLSAHWDTCGPQMLRKVHSLVWMCQKTEPPRYPSWFFYMSNHQVCPTNCQDVEIKVPSAGGWRLSGALWYWPWWAKVGCEAWWSRAGDRGLGIAVEATTIPRPRVLWWARTWTSSKRIYIYILYYIIIIIWLYYYRYGLSIFNYMHFRSF